MSDKPWRAVIVGLPDAPPRVHVESGPGNTWTVTAVSGGARPAGESADAFTKRVEAFLLAEGDRLQYTEMYYCYHDDYRPLMGVVAHYRGSEITKMYDVPSEPGVVY